MKRKREGTELQLKNISKIRKFTPEKSESLKYIFQDNEEEYRMYKRCKFTKEQMKYLNKGIIVNDNFILLKFLKTYILDIISESKTRKEEIKKVVKNKIKRGDFLLNSSP